MAQPRNRTAVLATTAFAALAAHAAAAQTPPRAKPAAPAQAIDPKAMSVLKASCAALKNAKTLSFTAVDTYERAARNGQPLYYAVKSQVTLQRPDKLKVVKLGDGVPDEFYYDGRTVTAYVPSQNLAAVADAPKTVDDMLAGAWANAEMHFPFADVLVAEPCEIYDQGLKSAFYVGQSKVVGGTTTDMVAVTLDHAQGELWIGADDHLPRLVRTSYPKEPARAFYQTEYSDWRVNAPVPAGTFSAAERAKGARRIAFQPPSAATRPMPAVPKK